MSQPTSSSTEPLYRKTVVGGGMWSRVIGRSKTLRLTDIEGGVNVGMLMYNAHQPLERYNMPDTLKGQHIFFLTHPFCLHSDMGRLLASVTSDTVGWHDTVCGCSDGALVNEKYGELSYQQAGNDFHRNARENFLIELAKSGLGERDLMPNLNLFSKVAPDEAGSLSYTTDHSRAGDHVELRFEMDTLVVLNTCQHPLDPDPVYRPRPVLLEVFEAAPVADDDPCRGSRAENERAFLNTADYLALAGQA